jgi:hypothetical protein
MNLDSITDGLIDAKPAYLAISPGWTSLVRQPFLSKGIGLTLKAKAIHKQIKHGDDVDHIVAGLTASAITGKAVTGPMVRRNKAAHIWASHHSGDHLIHTDGKIEKLGEHKERKDAKGDEGSRGWIASPGRYRMVLIYHEADKAGPHIDVHIGSLSLVYRVKPDLYRNLRFNTDGTLTANSKQLLITHVRNEIAGGSRVPQNLDHPDDQATYSWLRHEDGPEGYGAGRSRQIVSESEVEVYKAYQDGPIEFFAPVINPSHALYLYRIYPGTETRAPICIWGQKEPRPPEFKDRLHLRMVDPTEASRWESKLDMSTSAAKYDGSSVYLVLNQKGTRAYSPRISKRTGQRIEYTPKINGVAAMHVPETTIAMGELMFYKEGRGGKKIWLDHATSGGILNSHDLLPAGIKPMVVIYRVDKVGRKDTSGLSFWEQRELASSIVSLDPDNFMLPELMSLQEAKKRGFEGVVICPPDAPISEGVKIKLWTDADDWRVDSVDFSYSEKGNIQGVVWFTSLESGKKFKLGPGGVGDRETCIKMMENPDAYVGTVAKVRSRHGHEGRAAKLLEWHPDKGFAPPEEDPDV